MSQINPDNLVGLVRTETQKGDENREKPYTAIERVGYDRDGKEILRRRELDAGEAESLQKRLDKDRSRMEREGTRAPEREQERRLPQRTASREAQQEWLRRNFSRKQY